jgi:hemerythrin
MYITWDESYSVKINTFDNHHKKLFELVNEFFDAMKAKKDKEIKEKTLAALADYTVYHFAAEEKVMIEHSYPNYAAHKAAHTNLLETVTDLNERIKSGAPVMSAEVISFLANWLKSHIKEVDKAYSQYLTDKGVK